LLLLHEFDGIIRQFVGDVTFLLHPVSIDIERVVGIRWQVMSLSPETHPVVKSWAGRIGFSTHVPLADVGGCVASLLQPLWEKTCPLRHESIIVDDPMLVSVKPRQDGSSTGGAERGGHKGILEMDTISRDCVHMWRFQKWMAHEAHRIVTMVISKDEDDIPLLGSRDRFNLHSRISGMTRHGSEDEMDA